MSHRTPSQRNLPTKPISLEATANLDPAPPAARQTAHLSEAFIENKAHARFFPLINERFWLPAVRCLPTRKLRSKPIVPSYLYENSRKAPSPPTCPKSGTPTILNSLPRI